MKATTDCDKSQAIYCLCGAAWKNLSPQEVKRIGPYFYDIHSGAGHGPATARQAALARRRTDKDEEAA